MAPIIFLLNVHTREDKTGKAVKNEDYAFRKFLQQSMDRNIELYMVCHDDCSEATVLIRWCNSIMRARAAQQNREYVDCIDAGTVGMEKRTTRRHGTNTWNCMQDQSTRRL